ncbi:MAG: hypothetical protein ABSG14_13205 [Verrucomicrobiia bacterium]
MEKREFSKMEETGLMKSLSVKNQMLASLIFGLPILVTASVARAQYGYEDPGLFGNLGQLNSQVTYVNDNLAAANSVLDPFQDYSVAVGPNACVPTATADALTYLQAIYGPLTYTPTYTSVNNLASEMQTFNLNTGGPVTVNGKVYNYANKGGTYTINMLNGLQAYLGLGGDNPAPTISISGEIAPQTAGGTPASWLNNGATLNLGMNIAQNTIPTAAYLANALNDNWAVELTFEWGNLNGSTWNSLGGGHEVALDSIDLNGTTGTIEFVDPAGTNGGTNAVVKDATLTLGSDGYLYVTGQTYIGDVDDFAPGDGQANAGRIDVAMIESVPEPSTCSLAIVGSLVLLGTSFNRSLRGIVSTRS